jgi:GTP-binding protein
LAHVDASKPFVRTEPQLLKAASRFFERAHAYNKIEVLVRTRTSQTFPATEGEVAFVGRSNVGKSSLLNALTFTKKLALTSATPGCTQTVGFYEIGQKQKATLVDLPGYGFAKAPVGAVNKWNILIGQYIRLRAERENLKRVFLLVDSRHGMLPRDKAFARFLDEFKISYQVVLTKVDRVTRVMLERTLDNVREFLKMTHPEPEDKHPRSVGPVIHLVSSKTQDHGLPELRHTILSLLCPGALLPQPHKPRGPAPIL